MHVAKSGGLVSTLGRDAVAGSEEAAVIAFRKAREPRENPAAADALNNDRSIPVTQSLPPRRFVYGETRVGGATFFYDNANPWLYMGVALSDGVIESVDNVYFGPDVVPLTSGVANSSSRFNGKLKLEYTLGLDTETASALLTAAFPSTVDSTFRQRGVARAVVAMDWGTDNQDNTILWGQSITPSLAVKGTKVYDKRDGTQSEGTSSTWKFARNPILQIAHAVTHVWGAPIATSFIDWDRVSAGATICDTASTTTTGTAFTLFTAAGVFVSSTDYGQQISDMLSACGGSIYMSNGKYVIKPDQAETSIFTVTDADIIGVQSYTHEGKRRNTPNAIKAKFYNVANASADVSTTVENSAAVTAEGLREKTIDLPWTDNELSAQVLAYRALVSARAGKACALVVSDVAAYFEPTERITISSASFPVMNGDYRVEQVEPQEVGFLVQLSQYDATAYNNPNTYVLG